MANNIPITTGQGQASVATEQIGTVQYQQIKVAGGEVGSTSMWGITPDGSAKVSVIGTVNVTPSGQGSVIAVFQSSSIIGVVTGSVVAVPTGNQSVSGTVGASVVGWVPIQASNTSVIGYIQNSVAVVIIGGSVAATVTPAANQSVSGTVGASIIGWAPIQPSNTSTIGIFQNSSIIAVPVGSVISVFQSSSILAVPVGSIITTNIGSVITVWKDSSILSVPVSSTIVVFQAPSIVGTYAEDAASGTGDKGFLVMGARNDTLASVTSADGDYSSHVVGPAGELIAANAPFTKWVTGTADFRQGNAGASIIVIAAQGSSVFSYITAVQVANMGSASVLVTLAAGGSILGYTIAPAGGGSNINTPNAFKTPANFGFAASLSGIASVLVSAQGFIAKI